MDVRVLVVAPFAELVGVAQEVVKDHFSDQAQLIQVVVGDREEGLAVARQAVAEGVDVIVSRGCTASLLAECLEIPVVPIQVNVLELLRALRRVGDFPAKVGVAGFENIIYGCEDLQELWGVSFSKIALENAEEAPEKIAAAVREGVGLIVGDAISVKMAAQFGIKSQMILSGKDAVYQAIREAQMLARVRRGEQERAELLRTVIDTATDGIIALDVNSRVAIINPMAQSLLQASESKAIGRPIQELIPHFHLTQGDVLKQGDIQQIGSKTIAIKSVPIKVNGKNVGALANLQNVSQLQRYEQNVRKRLYAKGLIARVELTDIVGASEAMQAVKRKAILYAATQSTILITGESGTGKEMLAQSIHNLSKRRQGPFVAVNCAALPEQLLESELFGYEEGAFTGAKKGGKQGFFELAHGGTIFLDEIGEMTLPLQARLLRVLQEKEVMRVGGDSVIPVDVRVIAATNQNLATLMEEKKFRLDLYYRLNILRVHMPSLAERVDDIPQLARHMLREMTEINLRIKGISDGAVQLLQSCHWHGNVRQLSNVLERAMLLSDGTTITTKDLAEALSEDVPYTAAGSDGDNLLAMEQKTLERVLAEEGYNYARAAQRLGIHRTTLWRKLGGKLLTAKDKT